MKWTKLRSALGDLLAPRLRGRLSIHQARYRRTGEEVGRVWIELDGEELASFDTNRYVAKRAHLGHDIRSGVGPYAAPPGSGRDGYLEADRLAREALRATGEYDDYSALVDLEAYLSLPVEDALISPSPLIRGLAIVDRRVGRRRLGNLAGIAAEHDLVRQLYAARCEAEGLTSFGPPGAESEEGWES